MRAPFPITSIKLFAAFLIIGLIGLTLGATVHAQSFASPVSYDVGSNPSAAPVADLNADNKLDLVVAATSTNNVSVFLGNGDGTFGARADYSLGRYAYGVVITDLNGDGKRDLVAISAGLSGAVSVLLGNGDGTFQTKVDYALGGMPLGNFIFAGDFNNDGKSDIAVLDSNGAAVFLGNGNGALNPPTSFGSSTFSSSMVVGDFNADNKIDLAISNYVVGGVDDIRIMLGVGDGTFSLPVSYPSAPGPSALVTGDFNGDNKVDLATANNQVSNVSVLLGNGDGTFPAAVNYPADSVSGISIGDLNSDGKSDLITAGNPFGLGILKGNGDGTFQKSSSVQAGGFLATIIDLNADNKPDIISAGQANSVDVLMNQTGPLSISGVVRDSNNNPFPNVTVTLTAATPVTTITDASGSYSFNDLAASQTYTVTPAIQNYTFAPLSQTFSNLMSNATANFVGTLNTYSISGKVRENFGDGLAGVTVTLSGSMSATVITGSDGNYTFTNLPAGGNYTVTPTLAKYRFVSPSVTFNNLSSNRVANFVGLVATYTISGGVNVVNGFSEIGFTIVLTGTRTGTAVTGSSGYSFSNLPVDGDYTVTAYPGSPTALFTNFLMQPPASRSFTGLSSNVTANFNAMRLSFSPGDLTPEGVARGDLNGDGKLDLAVATSTGNRIHILLGNGDGTFAPQVGYTSGGNPYDVVIVDFNGDGKPDVASANSSGSSISVFLGNGDGTLQPAVSYPVNSQPNKIETADFNNDGKLDLATLGSPNKLSILLGNGNGSFQAAMTTTVSSAVLALSVADVNLDGKLDLLTLGFPGSVLVLIGRGDGTFENPVSYSVGGEVTSQTLDDFNGDGKLDVAVVTRLPSNIKILLGHGDGTFQNGSTSSFATDTRDVISQDFDGDGRRDLAVFNGAGIGFMSGLGDGTFLPAVFYQAGSGSFVGSLISGDFNNDGKLDVAITSGNDQVGVLLNNGLTKAPSVQLSSTVYSVNESAPFAAITVTRSGDVSVPVTVKYGTSDATDVNFICNPNTAGQITGAASRKCDYHIASGRLRFAAGETSKTIVLSINNDVYVEPTESLTITLSSPTGAVLGTTASATVNIIDNDTPGQANPIDGTAFYVRMLYVDLLSREPDPAGNAGWIHRIDFCGQPGEPPPPCDRVTVGGDGFLRSAEFFDREFFVIRLYRTALGRIPRYDDVADLAYVSGFLTDSDLALNKQELVNEIMSRSEFGNLYNSVGSAQFVDTLISTSGVTLPAGVRDGWVNALVAVTKTRAQVFRELSERPEVSAKYLHEAQVVSCYYGFFTRNPDGAYFNFLQRYDNGEINLGDLANAFINAAEYRQRFGP